MSRAKTTTKALVWSAEQLTRASNAVEIRDGNGDTVLDRIDDAIAAHPKAARWDSGGTSNRPWCWAHERELRECHKLDLTCLADDIVGGNDSTGDQAAAQVDRSDRAAADLATVRAQIAKITEATETIIDILERYPAPRPATAYERSVSADNAIGCESCARVKDSNGRPLWGEPRVNGSGNSYRTDKAGLIDRPMFLCQRCDTHVTMKGVLPPKAELEGQVKDKAGRRVCNCEDRREVWSNGQTAPDPRSTT